jgi:hypothetical protein
MKTDVLFYKLLEVQPNLAVHLAQVEVPPGALILDLRYINQKHSSQEGFEIIFEIVLPFKHDDILSKVSFMDTTEGS